MLYMGNSFKIIKNTKKDWEDMKWLGSSIDL